MRQGLHADYVEREEALRVLRGRLDIPLQVLARFGQLDRLHCHFDEHEFGVPENQFLRSRAGGGRSARCQPGLAVADLLKGGSRRTWGRLLDARFA